MGAEDGDPGGLLPGPTRRAPAVTPPGPGCPGRTGGGCGVPAPRTKSGCARGWASLASARPFQALSRVSPLPLAFLDVPGPVQDPRVVLRPSEPGARQAAWLRGGLRGCVVPPGERGEPDPRAGAPLTPEGETGMLGERVSLHPPVTRLLVFPVGTYLLKRSVLTKPAEFTFKS